MCKSPKFSKIMMRPEDHEKLHVVEGENARGVEWGMRLEKNVGTRSQVKSENYSDVRARRSRLMSAF